MREYFTGKCIFGTGLALTVADLIAISTGVVGLVGTILMATAGWYSMRIKKLELEEKQQSQEKVFK